MKNVDGEKAVLRCNVFCNIHFFQYFLFCRRDTYLIVPVAHEERDTELYYSLGLNIIIKVRSEKDRKKIDGS